MTKQELRIELIAFLDKLEEQEGVKIPLKIMLMYIDEYLDKKFKE